MFYCESCRVDKGYPASMSQSAGFCEICGETKQCHDVPSGRLKEYEEAHAKDQPYRFVSTAFWYAPGMCENYKRARRNGDKQFCKIFEGGFPPDTPREVFDLVAEGKFEIVGEDKDQVIVTMLNQEA